MPSSNPTSDRAIPVQPDRWVVGFDGSPASEIALAWATTHAPTRTCYLDVVTSWQAPLGTPESSTAMSITEANALIRTSAESEAFRGVDIARRALGDNAPITVSATCSHGSASSVLLDEAGAAAMLIVGNRGRGGFSRLLLGSTSHQCATHAAVPTVIVRDLTDHRSTSSIDRIVVGVDGSKNSVAALQWAIDFAAPGTQIVVTWVWDVSPLAVGADQFFFPEASDLAKNRFAALMDDHRDSAAASEVVLVDRFLEGPPRSTLLDIGESADLLVVGARGHGAVGAALLGSVSSWLVHHADRTVVVVPSR